MNDSCDTARNDAREPAAAARRLATALHDRFGETFEIPADLAGIDELARIAGHATHRQWADTPVDPALSRLLAACALSAPSKSDLQQADIIELRDPARREALAALLPTLPWFASAPLVVLFCGNGRRFRRLFERAGQAFANEHLDGFFNPAVDAALVMMNYLRAASAAGLVHCPISLLRDQPAEVARILGLPAHVFPVAGLCVGHPVATRSVVPRLPLDETFHLDGFDDRGQDERIDGYDARRAAIEAGWGRQNPQPWSQAKRAQYAQAHRADWGAFVRGQGFSTD
ncbi:MAG: nitroreductase family protein [Burkholderiaceae bacterium]